MRAVKPPLTEICDRRWKQWMSWTGYRQLRSLFNGSYEYCRLKLEESRNNGAAVTCAYISQVEN